MRETGNWQQSVGTDGFLSMAPGGSKHAPQAGTCDGDSGNGWHHSIQATNALQNAMASFPTASAGASAAQGLRAFGGFRACRTMRPEERPPDWRIDHDRSC